MFNQTVTSQMSQQVLFQLLQNNFISFQEAVLSKNKWSHAEFPCCLKLSRWGRINVELAGQWSLCENPRIFHFISDQMQEQDVPPFGFNSASRPTSLPRQTGHTKSFLSSVASLVFTCPHQELFLCSTKLKKFLIKIHHLKGAGWEMLKIIGLHSWIKNINTTKEVLLCSSTKSSCTPFNVLHLPLRK